MKITKTEFVTSAVKPKGFPPPDRPEIAFGGRSNVGKSSLINAMLQRKRLVKVSSTPGRTQLINFFGVNDELYFVDLPGYGFAKVPEAVREKWGPMIETYLSDRPNLRGLVVIMDLRRGVQDDDMMLIESAPLFGVQPILVFTKADKFSRNQQSKRRFELASEFGVKPDDLILFSSKDGTGRDALWDRIRQLTGI